MITDIISELFQRIGFTWLLDTGVTLPEPDDIERVLDKAAVVLYDGDIGDRMSVPGLIVEKTKVGYDVYAYTGTYT